MSNLDAKQIKRIKLNIKEILEFSKHFPEINKSHFEDRLNIYKYFVKDNEKVNKFKDLSKDDQVNIIVSKLNPITAYNELINRNIDTVIKKATINKKAFTDYYKIYLKYIYEGYNFSDAEDLLLYKLKKEYEEFSHINLIQMMVMDIKKINRYLSKKYYNINFE